MGTVLAIFQRPLKVFIVFKCHFKTAFDIPMTLFMNKNAIIMINKFKTNPDPDPNNLRQTGEYLHAIFSRTGAIGVFEA